MRERLRKTGGLRFDAPLGFAAYFWDKANIMIYPIRQGDNRMNLQAIAMSAAAGACTLIGGAAAVLLRPAKGTVAASLGLASGVMLAVAFGDLLPSAIQNLSHSMQDIPAALLVAVAFVSGILAALLLDNLVPDEPRGGDKLMRLGIFSAAALIMHNIPEGMAVYIGGVSDERLGLSTAVAVALHNIPEGIMVVMPMYGALKSRGRPLFAALAASISEPAGAVAAARWLGPLLTAEGLACLFAGIAGLMTYISAAQLLPEGYRTGRWETSAGFAAGALIMAFCEALLR